MNFNISALRFAVIFLFLTAQTFSAVKGDAEYIGQFDSTLVANTERLERIVFKPVSSSDLKSAKPFSETAHITMNRLQNPTGQAALVAILVEDEDEKPVIFVDLNADNSFGENEKIVFEQEEKDNSYLWKASVNLPVRDNFFTSSSVFLRFFKDFRTPKMTDGERLIQQSTEVFARGAVDVKGKKVLVQYAYSFENKKITPDKGWLGVDADENGDVDMDSLSPEAARADSETIVFRVGQTYLSTKKADVAKNQIVMREHQAKDYKRTEFNIGKELPDFSFVDLNGKKRKFSEFRGKYVLLDFWGFWCPPCREELPYLREAYKRFQTRNLEIVGMNTDDYTPESIKKSLVENGMTWTQARADSFTELKDFEFRIESFPTTFLIAPDGKILSMSRHDRGEPDLRGNDLLTTLDEILPKK
jgi:thiol-disulfide isomerase/thioredoxin